MSTKPIRVFCSIDLSGSPKCVATQHYKPLVRDGEERGVEITGKQYDVTQDVFAGIVLFEEEGWEIERAGDR